MKKIIIHWSAGTYYPTLHEKQCYHYLIDKNGKVYSGIHKPEDNLNCQDGIYAAHTGGGNTGSIGVAMCAMADFKNEHNCGNFPITLTQFEACMKLCAVLAQKYGIPVLSTNIMTHYEFGMLYPKTTSHGKIDITYLPCYPNVKSYEAGDFLRQKIRWYMLKLANFKE